MVDTKSKFFTFNIGHLLTIIIYIGTAGYYIASVSKTLEQHGREIVKIQEDVKSVQTKINGMTFEKAHLDAVDFRLSKVESALSKIDVLQNDMDWFKRFLLAEQDKKLNNLLNK